MSTATAEKPRKARSTHYELTVNSYDRASSLLIALLVMVGVTVVALAIIFFARRVIDIPVPVPFKPVTPAEKPSELAMGLALDPEPPGVEEAPELNEPQLMDTLNALTNAVSEKVAVMSDVTIDANDAPGAGDSRGDRRAVGDGPAGGPQPEWKIEYQFAGIDDYARWYDFYKIELVSMKDGREEFIYASNLSAAKPTVRRGHYTKEKRQMVYCSAGDLYAFDQQLARKAGILGGAETLLQALPDELRGILGGYEVAEAKKKGKTPEQVEQTVFVFETNGTKFSVSVRDQLYY